MPKNIFYSLISISLCLSMVIDPICLAANLESVTNVQASCNASISGKTRIAYRTRRFLPPPTTEPPSNDQTQIELTDGTEQLEKPRQNKIVVASAVPAERLKELLKRLPAAVAPAKSAEFNIPFSPNPPHKPGAIVNLQFPQKEAPAPPKPQLQIAPFFTVLRKSPEGAFKNVPQVSVTFSQAMVPIAEAESEALSANIPVKITPQPPGKWRWLGTQTLVFTPAGKQMPGSTIYKVEIPKGTKSALGGKLENTVSWTINVPAVTVKSIAPPDISKFDNAEPCKLDQTILVVFDQAVDPQKVLSTIYLREGKKIHNLRLATEKEIKEEIAGDSNLTAEVKHKRVVAFRATELFQKKQQLKIAIGPNIPSAEGPLLQKQVWYSQFKTYWPLDVSSSNDAYAPSGSMNIEFNNPLAEKLLNNKMFTVKPEVPGMQLSWSGRSLTISGSFQANAKYNVTLDKSIQDIFGQTLAADKTISIGVGQPNPRLVQPEHSMAVLQPSKKPSFSFLTTNLPMVKVNVYATSGPQDYRKFLKSQDDFSQWHERIDQYKDLQGFKNLSSKVISLPKATEEFSESLVELSPYLRNGLGHVIVTAEKWPRKKDEVQRFAIWLQCTKIGVDAFTDGATLVSLATRLEDGSPIPDVQVNVEGKTPLAGNTDQNGISRLPLVHGYPSIIFCRRGDDQAFLPSTPDGWVAAPSDTEQVNKQDTLRWYCVTDRNLYRPGEKVEVKGWVRRFGAGPKGDISLLKSTSADGLEYQIHDGNGNKIGKGKTKLDQSGGYNFEFDIPKTANLGQANIGLTPLKNGSTTEFDSGTSAFRIEEFRRPEFELSVKSSKGGSMIFGESTNLLATASYFAGGPLADAPLHWDVQSSPTSYSPPGWTDFVFGKQVQIFCFYDFGMPYGEAAFPNISSSLDAKTDSNGKHVLQLKVKKLAEDTPISLVAEGTVTDVNRQQWTDKATILMHPADVYVGIRSLKQFYKADEQVRLESIVTDLDGKASAGRSVHIDVVRMTQSWKDNTYKTEEEKISSTDIQSATSPIPWNLEISKGGSVKVSATVTDARGRKNKSEFTFWKEEKQPEVQRKVEQGKILVLADRKTYKPGETAELMIQAPFSAGKGVLTVRHNGLSTAIPISLAESAGSIKIPITDDFMPNANVQIDLVGSNCAFASGALELSIPADSRKISLDVSPQDKAVAPGGKTKLSFRLKDANCSGLADSQIAVAVVDESVLALAGYNWDDPVSIFYANSSPNTGDYHARSMVLLTKPPKNERAKHKAQLTRIEFESDDKDKDSVAAAKAPASMPAPLPGGPVGSAQAESYRGLAPSMGGGGGGKAGPATTPISIRTDFSALAYFNPSLITDSNGNASCEIKLPDNLTRYRIMAVAVAGEKLCGKGESSLTARLPLMVRPSAPRFLNFGDRCELPLVLQNQTDSEMSVDLGLRAANLKFNLKANEANLDLTHTSGGTVLVPANDRVEVRFPVSTEDDGTATVDIAASSQEFADAAKVSFPVYTPATSHAFAAYGQIDEGGANQTVEFPKDVFAQIGGLELSTSSTNLQSLTDAYIYIHDYSFECSEQLSSRILSTTALQDVLSAFNKMTPSEIAATRAQIQTELKELCKRQNDDGSFGLWKRGEVDHWPFVSIQVARSLQEAKQRNYEVPDSALSKAKEFLKAIDSHLPHNYDQFTRRSLDAYALFVRHLMKDSQPGIARHLIQTSLASYDSKDKQMRRSHGDALQGISQQDKLLQVFSMETLAWLLPVLSAEKGASASPELALLRSSIAAHMKETASMAEVVDDSYGDYDYCVFYSSSRLNATMLEALILDQPTGGGLGSEAARPKNDVIAKLANSLLAHRRAGRWASTQENCAAILALSRYFNTYEKQVPDFVANTWLGAQYLGASKFAGRSTDTQVINVPMRYLIGKQQEKDVLIAKTGKGRLYYRLALNYAPKELMLGAYDNGFALKRTYEAVDDPSDVKKDASGVWHIKAGATVEAKIELSVPGHRYHVALTDPLPAGMEPINSSLAGNRSLRAAKGPDTDSDSEQETGVPDLGTEGASFRWFPWWNYNWYDHQNLRDFRAEVFSSSLYSGKFNYSYLMRATTPGEFIVPPAKAEEMYTPETFGRAASERVIIE